MNEIDYLLNVNSTGLIELESGDALNNNILDWLANAEGSIADQPEWGHNLERFKFQPQGSDTEAMIEMAITSKLPRDVVGLKISGVRVVWESIHECLVVIQHQYGQLSTPIHSLSKAA